MEYELIAMDTTCLKAKWLKNILSVLYIIPRPILSISVHIDSRSTIEISKQENANKEDEQTYSDQTQVCTTPIRQSFDSRLCKV